MPFFSYIVAKYENNEKTTLKIISIIKRLCDYEQNLISKYYIRKQVCIKIKPKTLPRCTR